MSEGGGLAVRRLAFSTNVDLCDLREPLRTITMSGKTWKALLDEIRRNTYSPLQDGAGNLLIRVEDEASSVVETVVTTATNYQRFQRAAAARRFDRLPDARVGKAFGRWVTASDIIYEPADA